MRRIFFWGGGGGGGGEVLRNILPTFFLLYGLYFAKKLVRRRQIKKKQIRKGVIGHFLEHFEQKIAFFRRPFPPKLVTLAPKALLEKF